MPAYVYKVRRREPKGGVMAVLPPDPPVVAAVEPEPAPVDAPAEIIAVEPVKAAVEVPTTRKPRRRQTKKSDG